MWQARVLELPAAIRIVWLAGVFARMVGEACQGAFVALYHVPVEADDPTPNVVFARGFVVRGG